MPLFNKDEKLQRSYKDQECSLRTSKSEQLERFPKKTKICKLAEVFTELLLY